MANPALTDSTPKEVRLRLGPKAIEAIAQCDDTAQKVQRIEQIVIEHAERTKQINALEEQVQTLNYSVEREHCLLKFIETLSSEINASKLVTQERFRRLGTMHLTTRALVGLKLSAGSEKEQLLAQADALLGKIQAYTDTLELTDQQKQQAREDEVARMQQLLTEAGSYHQEQDHQMEQGEQNMGGQER